MAANKTGFTDENVIAFIEGVDQEQKEERQLLPS